MLQINNIRPFLSMKPLPTPDKDRPKLLHPMLNRHTHQNPLKVEATSDELYI